MASKKPFHHSIDKGNQMGSLMNWLEGKVRAAADQSLKAKGHTAHYITGYGDAIRSVIDEIQRRDAEPKPGMLSKAERDALIATIDPESDMSFPLPLGAAEDQALMLCFSLAESFPGLIDGETPINGADLISHLSASLDRNLTLKKLLTGV